MPGPNRASKVQHNEAEERRLHAWRLYNDLEDRRPIREKAKDVGVNRTTFHTYIAEMTVRYAQERSDERDRIVAEMLRDSRRLTRRIDRLVHKTLNAVDEEGVDESNPLAAKAFVAELKDLHDMARKGWAQETKLLGLDAPTKTINEEKKPVTAEEVAKAKAEATPEEVKRLRGLIGKPEFGELVQVILQRAATR